MLQNVELAISFVLSNCVNNVLSLAYFLLVGFIYKCLILIKCISHFKKKKKNSIIINCFLLFSIVVIFFGCVFRVDIV